MQNHFTLLFVVCCSLLSARTVRAGLGDLDPAFGPPGRVLIASGQPPLDNGANSGDRPRMGMALQGDGKIVVVMGTRLLRFSADGVLDPSFGGNPGQGGTGWVTLPVGIRCWAVVVQGDGKIVTAGSISGGPGNLDFAVLRYLADGTLDPTFGSGGVVQTDFAGFDDYANAIALQSDGKILVVGSSPTGSPRKSDFAVVRYLANGTLDATFHGDGRVTTGWFISGIPYDDVAYSVAVGADGTIVVTGKVFVGYQSSLAEVISGIGGVGEARYAANGVLLSQKAYAGNCTGGRVALRSDGTSVIAYGNWDPGLMTSDFRYHDFLGQGGVAAFSDNAEAVSVAIQSDGKVVLAGSVRVSYGSAFAVARFNADNTPDITFVPYTGMTSIDFAASSARAQQVLIQADGKILIGGYGSGSLESVALTRLLPDGTLDPTFRYGGRVVTPFGFGLASEDQARAVAVQTDGKIVQAGSAAEDFAVARYLPNGSLDTTFNGTGKAVTAVGSGSDIANAVAVQADGKIIAAGSAVIGTNKNFALVRYRTAGSLDTTFDGDGKLTVGFSENGESIAYGVAVQSDGKIVAAGVSTSAAVKAFAIARFLPDGSMDTTFGTGLPGRTRTDFPTGDAEARALVLQPDGKIVAVGSVLNGNSDIALVRYLADGTLDPNFGSGGRVTTHIFGFNAAYGVALQRDGKIVVAGTGGGNIAVVRYLADGTLDPAFGTAGIAQTAITPGGDTAFGVVVQANGRIVVAGSGSGDFILARLNPDGSLDATFHGTGTVRTDFSGGTDEAFAIALQSDGNIVVAGYSSNGLNNDFALARYQAADPDISVRQFSGIELSDGAGSVAFPVMLTGGSVTRTFTVRNVGGESLTGLGITFEGAAAAGFQVTIAPVAPLAGPNGSTTFTVQFSSATAGAKSAVLKIASNDLDENPFHIALTALVLTPEGDYDGDGVNNATEIALAALGFDPLVDSTPLITLLRNNAPGLGLYRAEDMQSLALGRPVIARNAETGNFHLTISVEKSPNLALPNAWTPLLNFTPTYDALTGKIDLEFSPGGTAAQFYRVLGSKP